MTLPVYQAKGLEIDAAIIIDEFTKKEKELFYVACSRAQHGLTVLSYSLSRDKADSGNNEISSITNNVTEEPEKPKTSAKESVVDSDEKNKTKIKTKKHRSLFRKFKDALSAAIDAFRGK